MKNKTCLLLLIHLLLVQAIFGNQHIFCQEKDKPENVPNVRFEIQPNKQTYYVAEPITLKLSMYNDSDQEVEIEAGAFSLHRGLTVTYRQVNKEFTHYRPRWVSLLQAYHGFSLPIKISKGKKEQTTATLFYNTSIEELVLSTPAQYEFQAICKGYLSDGTTKEIRSNIVRIKALNPINESRATLIMLQNKKLTSFIEGDLQIDLVSTEEVEMGAKEAEKFIKENPSSIYTSFVKEQTLNILTNKPLSKNLSEIRTSVLTHK